MRNPVRAATPNDFVISTIATMARSVEMIYPCLPNTADPKKWLSSQKWQSFVGRATETAKMTRYRTTELKWQFRLGKHPR